MLRLPAQTHCSPSDFRRDGPALLTSQLSCASNSKAQVVQAVSNFLDAAVVDDPYRLYAELRRNAPVRRIDGTDFFMASTWDAVQEAVSRSDDFSSNLTATLVHHDGQPAVFDMDAATSAGHVLTTADNPRHDHQRRIVLPGLVAKRIRALEPYIADVAGRLFVDAAHAGRVEWMAAIGDRLPMTLVARLIGLPEADVPRLVRWGYVSTELVGGVVTEDRLPVVVDRAMKLAEYLHDAFTAALATPADNLLGDLARAVATGDIDSQVALLMLVQLVGAGGVNRAPG